MSTTDDGSGFSFTDRPFAWAFIPLIGLFIICFVSFVLYNRRRKRLNPHARSLRPWPQQSPHSAPGRARGPGANSNNHRWAPWGGTRSQEGLNELGEAPPPYAGKKEEPEANGGAHELRDLEAGQQPPEYLAEPSPVANNNSHARRAA